MTDCQISKRVLVATAATWMLGLACAARAAAPTPGEMAEARQWVSAHFAKRPPAAKEPALLVQANHDPVQRNARGGRPLRIGSRVFHRGLYCHAPSKVQVRLPAPGKTFSAVVGVDSNSQTRGGRGSVVFSVLREDKTVFRSEPLREGMAGTVVDVPLEGARQFTLEVADGGDGNACDQADWAEARVALEDGRTLWLADLPMVDPRNPAPSTKLPFSFCYGGRPFAELAGGWKPSRETRAIDADRIEHTLRWNDPASGLSVRCAVVEYRDFPTVEWTLHFKNDGQEDTPLLSEIQPLDLQLERFPWPPVEGCEFRLHHQTGSPCKPVDYEPFTTPLPPGKTLRFAPPGGRPTDSVLPYFNLEFPSSKGLLVVVGWPGQWAAEFARDTGHGLRIRAGQQLTRFTLHPGEEVRSPLVVLQVYQGERIHAQNVWRRWMVARNLPRPGGKLPPVQLAACSSHQFGEMIHADTANQKLFVDRYLEEGLKLDYWWMDAGWYVNRSGWPNTGTWEVDTKRFPGGLRPICDHAHAKGVKTIVWFEPERVTPGTWLYEKHPEWLLGPDGQQKLLDLGNREARRWLTDHVDRLISEQGIDLYRQDFNMDPLSYWRANDAEDRQGITEIGHVTGYLAYWDELRRRHPDMLIDSCASGGRRNDLETLRRAVPLLRSDYIMEPIGNQGHTYGISFWIPYHGTGSGSRAIDPYLLRSVMCSHFTACFDVRRKDLDYEMIRRVLGQWRKFAPCFLGDYYPLTDYSVARDSWIAWQFDRPDLGAGMVQAFRREESPYEVLRVKLRGLDPKARYVVTDLDRRQPVEMTGRQLAEAGLAVAVEQQPGSAVIAYRRADGK